ncbi:putative gustatory receptor 39b [Drosophila innubila]|uniref:putative gustatory receptor 39b n=1 Tax=Drosophila innubila TaxID=198719 RepID=UPI00148B8179|nr:putative gustatory receptor 39b [Drosophila innubila]
MLDALHCYLKYFAVLGLVPWSEKRPQQRLQKIYTTAIMSINIGIAFYKVVYSPIKGDLPVSMLVSSIVYISQILTMSVIELQVMCQYERYYEFCLQLKTLNRLFQSELLQPIQGLPRARYIKFIALGILNIVSLFPGIYVVLHYDYIGYYWYSLGAILINRFQCLLLLLNAELLGYHVELLGLRLLAVLNCRQMSLHSVLDVKCEQMCSLEYLLSLKRAYMELYRLFGQFNGLYGWSIVSIFVVMFLDSMINIYWTLLILAKIYSFVFNYMTSSTYIPLLILLFTFCRCGEYCKRQHIMMGSYVRGLACTSQRQPELPELTSQAYNAVLAEFVLQVEQDVLSISAEGFMNIDYSLLMSIFTAMVTYLIVLMQFSSL